METTQEQASTSTDARRVRTGARDSTPRAAVRHRRWFRRHGVLLQELVPGDHGYTVLALNGAVDFDERYSLGGRDVYLEVAASLGLPFA